MAKQLQNSTVLLTGVTGEGSLLAASEQTLPACMLTSHLAPAGYIGALILELILRTCPEVKKVSTCIV